MSEDLEIVVGEVDAIFFQNPSNLYKVVRIRVDEQATESLVGPDLVITGQFAVLHLDTTYEFYGNFTNHPKYGEQFSVVRYQQVTPTSEIGLIDYLSSDRFPGIGSVLAERIVDTLGLDAIDKIMADPDCLKQVKGLTKATSEKLYDNLVEHRGTERVFIQLNEWGFGQKISEKIFQEWGSSAIDKIKENPYILIDHIEGIGFNKADILAEQLGIDALSLNRVGAAIYAAVAEHCMNDGHTYYPQTQALMDARNKLENSRPALISDELLQDALGQTIFLEQLFNFEEKLMIPSLYYSEKSIARILNNLLVYEDIEKFDQQTIDQAINQVITMSGVNYDQSQIKAMRTAIASPISIITGGPGTGKTTLIKGIILLHSILHDYHLEELSKHPDRNPILLAAPTGRAAKRMSETTGLPASTIHRMIGLTRENTLDDLESQELEGSLLIVDEMSMVDTWLMNALLKSVPYHMQVVFVGDADQLPSVGPGQVFFDLIQSQQVPTIVLTQIYRQAQESSIIELAHYVRQGQLPDNFLEKQHDRSFIPMDGQNIVKAIEQIVAKASQKGFDSTNLQVLAPMYKGVAGINELNRMLQELLNPPSAKRRQIEHYDKIFRVGDKVIQLVNNTEEGVFNGDIGKIEAIFTEKETSSKSPEIVVTFDDDRELVYLKNDLDQITLAYCTSIHKAQGSEYDLVILPLVDLYSRMLRKDLIYTAITRAQKALVMVGNPQSFVKAVSQAQTRRQTNLQRFLNEEFSDRPGPLLNETTEVNQTVVDIPKDSEKIQSQILPSQKHGTSLVMDSANEAKEDLPRLEDESMAYVLTMDNYWQVDPMIGMEEVSPYDFMPKESREMTPNN